MYVQVEF